MSATSTIQTTPEQPDNEALFKRLRQRPVVAIPTVLVMLVCHTIIAASWYLCLTDQMALWQGSLVIGLAMYFLFSPIHDAMHNAVFRSSKANAIFLFIAVFPIIPFCTGQFLRMMHMQHHRFANDPELDPDHDVSHTWKNMFFRWFFWELAYAGTYARNKSHYTPFSLALYRYEFFALWTSVLLMAWFIPVEMLFLWFVPGRIMVFLVCAVFMYLPHRPHTIRHADDPYKATLMRQGWDWLLTPLMAYQNYHLVHHLYPTVPFYRYKKVWDAKKQFHLSHDPAIVKAFQLNPENVPAAPDSAH